MTDGSDALPIWSRLGASWLSAPEFGSVPQSLDFGSPFFNSSKLSSTLSRSFPYEVLAWVIVTFSDCVEQV